MVGAQSLSSVGCRLFYRPLFLLILFSQPSLAETMRELSAAVTELEDIATLSPKESELTTEVKELAAEARQALEDRDLNQARKNVLQAQIRLVSHNRADLQFLTRTQALRKYATISQADYESLVRIIASIQRSMAKDNMPEDTTLRLLTGVAVVDQFLMAADLEYLASGYHFSDEAKSLRQELQTIILKNFDNESAIDCFDVAGLQKSIEENGQKFVALQQHFIQKRHGENVGMRILQLHAAVDANALLPGMDIAATRAALSKWHDASPDEQTAPGLWQKFFPTQLMQGNHEGTLFLALQLRTAAKVFAEQCTHCKKVDLDQLLAMSEQISDPEYTAQRTANIAKGQALLASILQLQQNKNLALEPRVFPHVVAEQNARQVKAMIDAIKYAKEHYDSQTTSWSRLNPWEKERSAQALKDLEYGLRTLHKKIKGAEDLQTIVAFNANQNAIKMTAHYILESVMKRSKTAPEYTKIFIARANSFPRTGSQFLREQDYESLRSILKVERYEDIRKAWVNRQTITTGALSVLLAAEVVSIVYSGGSSSALIPATSAALRVAMMGGKIAVAASQIILAADASARIYDRTAQLGFNGFASFDTLFDVMMILAVMPRIPLPTGIPQTTYEKVLHYAQKQTAMFQYGSLRQLSIGATLYASYQLFYADGIAAELNNDGINVTAWEIRRRSVMFIALSALSLARNQAYAKQQNAQNGEAFAAAEKQLSFKESLLVQRIRGAINPFAAGYNFYAQSPSLWRALAGAGIAAGYVGYDYVFINEAILLSYTNPDFNYMSTIAARHPFPTLRDGESALTLVGLDPLDAFLYLGAHAKASHASEFALYRDNYYIQDFLAPEDLLVRIKNHAKLHGPIRYLKIMTHGQPGRLYTRNVALTRGDGVAGPSEIGWIDREWLIKYQDYIRKVAGEAMAPDARIVLWACLTGSNLDWASDDKQSVNIGDEFLDALGSSMLPNGGAIDASNRILVGLDAVFGTAIRSAARTGIEFDARHDRPLVPLIDLEQSNAQFPLTKKPNSAQSVAESVYLGQNHLYALGEDLPGDSSETIPVSESTQYMLERVGRIMFRMHEIWYKYGLQLEGPWWHERYKYREFTAH